MKMKKIGVAALSILLLATAASCSGTRATIVMSDENVPTLAGGQSGSDIVERYSSFSLDDTNAKKIFYLGDEFTTEGLKVTLNYLKFYKNGGRVPDADAVHYDTNNYSVDTSLVDMSKVGTYPVDITCRVGTTTNTKTYNIEVRSSLLETTPNIEYIAGIDLYYKGATTDNDKKIKTYTIDSTINLSASDVEYKIHKRTVNDKLEITDTVLDASEIDTSKFSIDFDQIKNDEVGTYRIVAKYNNGTITAGGNTFQNEAVSCLLVNVKNDVTKIKVESGSEEFEASIDGIKLNDWKIRVTREKRGDEIVDYSDDLFTVLNFDEFLWGKSQTITIALKEDTTIKANKSVYINESTTMDIKKYERLTKGATAEADGLFKLAGTDFIFGPDVTFTDRSSNVSKDTDSYGALKFYYRFTIKGSSQPVKVVMDKPGKIVMFFASTSDEARELVMNDANGEEVATATSLAKKQGVTKYTFTCATAGTYTIVNPSGGMYIHGMVIAKAK